MDAIEPNARAAVLAAEIATSKEAGLNTLGLILGKLGLPPESRALDIGGVGYAGQESTHFIASRFTSQIDAVRPQTQDVDDFVKVFGSRVRLLDNLPSAAAPPYDLVVLLPKLRRTFDDLRHFAVTRSQLIRHGGYLIAHGLRPESVGSDAFTKAPAEVVNEFKSSFDFPDSYSAVLPPYLSSFRWFGQFPRKIRSRSFYAWYVFQKADAAPARVAVATVTINVPSPVTPSANVSSVPKRPAAEHAPAAVEAARDSARAPATLVSTNPAPINPAPKPVALQGAELPVSSIPTVDPASECAQAMAEMLRSVHRFGPAEYSSVTDEIAFIPPPAEVMEILAEQQFDTFMFVNNSFERDARVMKTAEAVHAFGRRLIAVGLSKGISYEVRRPTSGFPYRSFPRA